MRNYSLLVSGLAICMSLSACKPNDSQTIATTPTITSTATTQPALPSTSQPSTSQPSFDCTRTIEGSIEHLVCTAPELAALDNHLQHVYNAASSKAANEQPPLLAAEQNGWIKGRNECWKADDKSLCVKTEYQRRIAELQARYQLVAINGPFHFHCNQSPGDKIVVTFYESDTPTLIAEYKDQTALMYQVPAASGAKYQGRNESFWEHQGEATVVWGYNTPEFVCKKAE